jgi:exonuclease VII small subunit
MTNSEQATLEQALQQLDVPDDKAPEMAIQLNKRALQLAEQGERTYEQALLHLLNLMKTAHDERNK